jgi:hypothetical protein
MYQPLNDAIVADLHTETLLICQSSQAHRHTPIPLAPPSASPHLVLLFSKLEGALNAAESRFPDKCVSYCRCYTTSKPPQLGLHCVVPPDCLGRIAIQFWHQGQSVRVEKSRTKHWWHYQVQEFDDLLMIAGFAMVEALPVYEITHRDSPPGV